MYEHHRQPVISRLAFILRLARHGLISLMLVVGSLAMGTVGFHVFSGQHWIDALLNSAMLLGGMGPVGDLGPTVGKLFRTGVPDRGWPTLRAHLPPRAASLPFGNRPRQLELPSLTNAEQVTQRSHDDDAVGDRGRRHDHFLHVVLRDLRQTWTSGEDVDLAIFARDVQATVGCDW